MNGDKYEELIEKAKKAKTQKEKIDHLSTMVYMLISNDIHHLWKLVWVLLVLSILNLLIPDQWNLKELLVWFGGRI